METVTSMHGDVISLTLTPALSFRNNVTGNAMEHLKSVEEKRAKYLMAGRTTAGTSATQSPNPVKENAHHQTQSCAALNVFQIVLQSVTITAMESVSRSRVPAMEIALRDMLSATGIVTLNRTLTGIVGNVEENASRSPNLVMESA